MHVAGPCAVGLIGHGAIGGPVASALAAGSVRGCHLAGVVRSGDPPEAVTDLAAAADVVVEAAGQEALRAHGPVVVDAGTDLLVMSVGALIDPRLRARLEEAPGRVLVSTGAIGGIDLLRAASAMAPFDRVTLRTTKQPVALEQPWMSEDLRARLRAGDEALVVFEGDGLEAVERFPASVNVAATVGFATVGVEQLGVEVVADPDAERVEHRITAEGPAGSYDLRIRNTPSRENPRTSAVTPFAALRALDDLGAGLVWGV